MAPARAGDVRLAVRVRPIGRAEVSTRAAEVDEKDHRRLFLHDPRHRGADLAFDVDRVYSEGSTTEQIYQEQLGQSRLKDLFAGNHCTVFTHGATGSGKTFTMYGEQDSPGLVELAVRDVLALVESHSPGMYVLRLSVFELYLDKIQDLLAENNGDLQMCDDFDGNPTIMRLTEVDVSSLDAFQLQELAVRAASRRAVGKTALNESSSRSHCCVRLTIEKVNLTPPVTPSSQRPRMSFHKKKPPPQAGQLCLIDLAGCEDNGRTGNTGIRMQESKSINDSHFVLGKVLLSLRRKDGRVPYRDCKLTRLLKRTWEPSTTGYINRTLMLVTISPSLEKFQAAYNTFNAIQLQGRPIHKASGLVHCSARTMCVDRERTRGRPQAHEVPQTSRGSDDRDRVRSRLSCPGAMQCMHRSSSLETRPSLVSPQRAPTPRTSTRASVGRHGGYPSVSLGLRPSTSHIPEPIVAAVVPARASNGHSYIPSVKAQHVQNAQPLRSLQAQPVAQPVQTSPTRAANHQSGDKLNSTRQSLVEIREVLSRTWTSISEIQAAWRNQGGPRGALQEQNVIQGGDISPLELSPEKGIDSQKPRGSLPNDEVLARGSENDPAAGPVPAVVIARSPVALAGSESCATPDSTTFFESKSLIPPPPSRRRNPSAAHRQA